MRNRELTEKAFKELDVIMNNAKKDIDIKYLDEDMLGTLQSTFRAYEIAKELALVQAYTLDSVDAKTDEILRFLKKN